MRAVTENGQIVELLDNGSWRIPTVIPHLDEGSFRGVPWGTLQEEARRRERRAPDQDLPGMMIWSEIILGDLTCDVIYIYAQNVFVRAKYIVTTEWVNENRYLTEYSALQSLLGKKYGSPDAAHTLWHNNLWEDDPNDWGKAVEQGHLSLFSKWERGDTRVILSLSGENYSSTLTIEYSSLRFEALESAANEEALLGDL